MPEVSAGEQNYFLEHAESFLEQPNRRDDSVKSVVAQLIMPAEHGEAEPEYANGGPEHADAEAEHADAEARHALDDTGDSSIRSERER